jgi:simple sugar transport system permease protein
MTVAATAVVEQPTAHTARVVDRVAQHRARVLGALTAVIGIVAVLLFSRADGDATFILNARGDDTLPDLVVPAKGSVFALGLLAVLLGVLGATVLPAKRVVAVLAGGLVLFVAAMLVWATAGATTTLVGLFSGAIRRASPLALGALAGVLCERSGVVNIAIEGQLLTGAFAGAIVASATDSLLAGVVAGVVAGLLLGLVLGVLSIRYRVDQIVGATVINIFALGLTSFLGAKVLGENPDLNRPGTFRPFDIPLLADIPLLGPILFENTFHVFAMFVLVAVVALALFRTRWGLRVRAVGEHPSAADTVGIDVLRLRYVAVLLGGAVAGFGGTFFSLDSAGRFEENMTAGRGFIALAALIFGRWHPVGALGAALVFGFAEEFQGRLAALGSGIPSEFLLMAPYLVTLVVVAGLIGRSRAPAADGIPFHR